jgi:hypothetical protein
MADLFEQIDRRGDTPGVVRGMWWRRAILSVALAVPVLALFNVFGQQPTTTRADSGPATVALSAPRTVRGGLLFQSKLTISATAAIDQPRLVLGDGWLEGMQVNTIEPGADSEGSQDGHLRLAYGRIEAGERLVIWVESQVDPTNVGERDYGVTLQDGDTPIAHVDRSITVLP